LWFGADADAAYAFVGGIGIVKGLSEGLDEVARADAHEKLKAALRSHETPEGVRFGSAVWLITAGNPDQEGNRCRHAIAATAIREARTPAAALAAIAREHQGVAVGRPVGRIVDRGTGGHL